MILVMSDLHTRFELVDRQIEHAEQTFQKEVTSVLVVGDFGIFAHALRDFFDRKRSFFRRQVYFLEGNHEEFSHFERLVEKYKDRFTYLPRGTVHTIDGYRFLALGGSKYMDPLNTPMGSVIQGRDIDKALSYAPQEVDIVLTHDCPRSIGVPCTPGLEYYGPTGFERSEEISIRFRPRLWIFGHHHKWFQTVLDGTLYEGLAESWKGYGVLEPGFRFQRVQHEILPDSRSFWKGIWEEISLLWK